MNQKFVYKVPNRHHTNYHRLNSRQFSSRQPEHHKNKLIIIIAILLSLILLINLIPDKKSKTQKTAQKPSSGKVLSTNSDRAPIKLSLPTINKQLNIRIPQKNADATNITIPAKYAILLDADNAYPLYVKSEQERVPIASLTKIMTAIIALENYKLDQVAIVPQSAATISGSKMHLYTGEKITVENLLYGLMLPSGNDAAYALASLDPASKNGDAKPFIDKMNQKAKLLGLDNTHFNCPAGLDDTGYSTAHDLAFLTAYAIKNSTFVQITSTAQKAVNSADGRYAHPLTNTNRLVVPTESLYLPYALGIKTGYTEAAGHSLVGATKKDGHTLISVVLNTNNPAASESARLNHDLLIWGYNSFTWPE